MKYRSSSKIKNENDKIFSNENGKNSYVVQH